MDLNRVRTAEAVFFTGLAVAWPVLFWLKSRFEPQDWFNKSAYLPWLVGPFIEAFFIALALISAWQAGLIARINPHSKRLAKFMVTMGALSFCSIVMSVVLSLVMAKSRVWLPESLYIFAATFTANLSTFVLNRYFEKRLKEWKN